MIQYTQYLVFVGAFIGLALLVPYIKETIKGNTKPNRVTWLLSSIVAFIGAFASKGAGWSAVPIFVSGFATLLVFIVSFVNKKSYWKLEKFDYLCGFFSLLALLLWQITKEPIVAIIFAIISDVFATIPTLKKSWKYPETETASAYIGGLFSALTGFAAIKLWNFLSITFLLYLVIINALLAFLILRKKYVTKQF
jgi:hypothetical protein